jgi:hypothetical protein
MSHSTGLSSRSSRIPTSPSSQPAKDARELPGQSDTTDNNEPIKISSVRSPAKLLAVGWKKKAAYKNIESDYHRSK